MSHQTGISGSDSLKAVFSKALKGDSTRTIKVIIENESLVCEKIVDLVSEHLEKDFDSSVEGLIDDDKPCYLFMKITSSKNWLFITYSPDNSSVREKMMYAATRASLKSEFGGTYVSMEYFATNKNEVTFSGYKEFLKSKNAPPPLTTAEEELEELNVSQKQSAVGASTKQPTSKGIYFPLTNEARNHVTSYRDDQVTHVELKVDVEKEEIFSTSSDAIGASELKLKLPADQAGYHLFNYKHRFQDQDLESHIFIYYMPGYSIPIKQRMLYSSCKNSLLCLLENDFDLKFDRKLELDNANDLTEEFLRNEIHPPEVVARKKFNKPSAPGRKPPSRRNR